LSLQSARLDALRAAQEGGSVVLADGSRVVLADRTAEVDDDQ
jgi:hypothetical protein